MSDANSSRSNVFEDLEARAHRDPERTALVFEGERLSYGALLSQIEDAAAHLHTLGLRRGDRFAAFAQNRPEIVLLYYAAAWIGAVYVPLNPNLTAPEVEYAVRHSAAKILFHDAVVAATLRAAVPEAVMLLPIEIVRGPPAIAVPPRVDAGGNDDLLVIYTSGSTGTPKAILLDHTAQIGAAGSLAEMWDLTPADVTLVALPLGYLYGLSTAAAAGLQAGGTVVVLRRFHPRDVLEGLLFHPASIFHGVPTMYSMMLDYCEQEDLSFDLSGVRELICAGAPLPLETRRRFARRFGKELQDYYAMTEATPVFGKYSRDPDPVPEGSVGKAAPGLAVRIVRPDGTDCAPGEQGEILVRAAATMKAYLNAPEQTAAAFKGGLFRSGDLGHQDAKGFFHITGRIKDVIIRGGANISPSEVEGVLAEHPAVQNVAVVGAPDRVFGEVPVAFVVLRQQASVTEEDLVTHAAARLSDFKVPRRYHFETALPVGKTGKVDKGALRARCQVAVT